MSVRHDRRRRMLADEGLSDASGGDLDRALPGGSTRDGTATQRAYADAVADWLEHRFAIVFPRGQSALARSCAADSLLWAR